jgi:hypothetical protein
MKDYESRVREARANYKCCGRLVPEEYAFCPYCGEEACVVVTKTPEERYEDRKFQIVTIRNLYRSGHLERYRKERHRRYGPLARINRKLLKDVEASLLRHVQPMNVLGNFFASEQQQVTFKRGS